MSNNHANKKLKTVAETAFVSKESIELNNRRSLDPDTFEVVYGKAGLLPREVDETLPKRLCNF